MKTNHFQSICAHEPPTPIGHGVAVAVRGKLVYLCVEL